MLRVVRECAVAIGGGSHLVLALRCCAALGRRLLTRTLAARPSDAMVPAHSTAVVNVLYWAQQALDGELGRAMPVSVYTAASIGQGNTKRRGTAMPFRVRRTRLNAGRSPCSRLS